MQGMLAKEWCLITEIAIRDFYVKIIALSASGKVALTSAKCHFRTCRWRLGEADDDVSGGNCMFTPP